MDRKGKPLGTFLAGTPRLFWAPTAALALAAALSTVPPSPAAKLFAVSAQGTESTNEVYRFEVGPTGTPTMDLVIVDASFFNPFGIVFRPGGELLVVNRTVPFGSSGSVSRFLNAQGTPSFNGTITDPSFRFPHGATFRMGELFIAQSGGGYVSRFLFDGAGNALFNGVISAGLTGAIRGVTVNSSTGELFVTQCCDFNSINRYLFDAAGNAIPNGVITGGGMANPHDMAFTPWGELLVANLANASVSRFTFDAGGNAISNGQITGNGLVGPIGLAFSPWGELFVSSHFTPQIFRWTFDAAFNAIPNGSFATPHSLGELEFLSNQPPVAVCQNVTVAAGPACTANAAIDGGSFDPDGNPITLSQSPPGPYPLGSTSTTLTVTDSFGASSQCQAAVTVVDTTPPAIGAVTASPNVLWPPNHQMVPVTVSASASDNCSPVSCSISSVTSNEPIDGLGDGDASPDWVITGPLTVNLRAERSGTGSGRVYTATVKCTDGAGNSSTKTVMVTVPLNQK